MTVAGNTAGTGSSPLSGLQNTLGNLFGGNNQTQNQTQNQQQTSSVNTAGFTTNSNDTGLQIRTVYPPITPDKLIGVYDTPVPTLSLPNLKLDKITTPKVKNKNIGGYLKAIEQKITATEKLMKDIVKLQNLQILTEKEVSERKRELYQNTFEEYLLDKTVDFRDKKKKSCTCINLPDKAPAAPPIVAPVGGGSPAPATVPDTSTSAQPSTAPAPAPAPTPSPIFDWGNQPQNTPTPPVQPSPPAPGLPDWLNPKNWPKPQNPFPNGIPVPPLIPPNVEDLLPPVMGTVAVKPFMDVIDALKKASTEEEKAKLMEQALKIGTGLGIAASTVMRIIQAIGIGVGAATGLDQLVPQANGGIISYASGGIPGGDLELYSAESQSYFRDISNKVSNQIASDIPIGPHTPLPHPGYVKPQGSFIPKPNLRGMPGPMGNPMPWGYDPTKMLAKGGIVKKYNGGGFLNQLGKFLPGTGRVMAPQGMSLGFQNKFLGIPIGGRSQMSLRQTYKSEDVDRYNRVPTAPSVITTMGSGPLANRHISIPKTAAVSSSSARPSSKPSVTRQAEGLADRLSNQSQDKVNQVNQILGRNAATTMSWGQANQVLGDQIGWSTQAEQRQKAREQGLLKASGGITNYAGGGILSQLNKFNPMAHLLQLSDKVRTTLIPAPRTSKPIKPSFYGPGGDPTGSGKGQYEFADRPSERRRDVRPNTKPVTRQIIRQPEKVDPFAGELEQYNTLIKQGKTKEAEALGQQIWSRKYADSSMVKPKTNNPLITNNLESSQSRLTSNSSNKTSTVPLPADYIKIPGKSKNPEKNDDTMTPTLGVADIPDGPFSRETGYFE